MNLRREYWNVGGCVRSGWTELDDTRVTFRNTDQGEEAGMIVRDIMKTQLITVEPDDTLAHAANLLRQYQFHHLPVTSKVPVHSAGGVRTILLSCEGMISSHDIDLAVALSQQDMVYGVAQNAWQERHILEVMHRAAIRVTSTTSVAAAANILVERGLNCLPVVEYKLVGKENRAILVGLITRSDLLVALSRAMGAFEPGMQIDILLPLGDMTPLARLLQIA
ncbi:MAG TPA: CBS domain-containing protein, partial [Dictyobacter sp.]|nr:CBS domain-containing protein [Dictyobacter sp.]